MAYETELDRILAESRTQHEILHQYRQLDKSRRQAKLDSWRDRSCPVCHDPLHFHAVEWSDATLVLCKRCGFWSRLDVAMDEARDIREGGVAIPRQRTPTVVFRADGSIKEIRS